MFFYSKMSAGIVKCNFIKYFRKGMLKKACLILTMQSSLLAIACSKPKDGPLAGSGNKEKISITINPSDEKQTIHSFGASDCWTAKFIGKWADTEKKNRIADLLFSTDTLSDGSPKGIGLSLWRFNIGGGSFEQGAASNIADEWRREESFLDENGTYDWSKQQGQQWFLEAAKQRGVKYTLGFSLTPPVFMTQNGKAYNSSGGTKLNIKEGKLDAYADFMAEVTKHFQFDFLSPVNEPQWSWGKAEGAGQEGTQAENSEISSLVTLLSQKMAGTNSKIVVAEAGQWDFLYGKNNDNRGDQINQFFSASSPNYIGGLPNVAPIISGHSYFTTCPDNTLIYTRNQVAAKVKKVNPSLETWQTEFGILGNICNQYSGYPRNTGIDYGLYAAKVIHHDLAIADVTSWHWWLAMSPYDYSDALVYINSPSGKIDPSASKTDGIVLDSKQLWAFGNFARFVRPGMKRIAVSAEGISGPEEAAASLMVSAYKDEQSKKVVFVIINPEDQEKTVEVSGLSGGLSAYTTDASRNLKKSIVEADNVKLSPKSITTLIGTY